MHDALFQPARPETRPPPEALRDFAAVARRRFGLVQPGKRPDALERRLREAHARAGWTGDALSFVRELDLAADESPVTLAAVEALTNQETFFFRDVGQLQGVVRELVPPRVAASGGTGRPLRILSAGCSTGEEPLSLGMLLLDEMHLLWGRGVEVVGIDLCAEAVNAARAARYPLSALRRAGPGPEAWPTRFFREEAGRLVARELLRGLVQIHRANLMSPQTLAPLGQFDIVLCRNVLIYFDEETLEQATRGLVSLVTPGGALVLGHAEAGIARSLQPRLRHTGGVSWFAAEEATG